MSEELRDDLNKFPLAKHRLSWVTGLVRAMHGPYRMYLN